jgi:16S rRNA (cytosine1402-N4)-methyltransferase
MPDVDHVTVLLEEAVEALIWRADGIYVDATFGRGGHSRAILARLSAAGRLVALDRDPAAIAAGRADPVLNQDRRFSLCARRFSELKTVLAQCAVPHIDGLLLDLGVSSPQIEEAGRGFSFRADGPLDMRMDPNSGQSAAQWLAEAPECEIGEVIADYGEERFAKQIARALVAARARAPISTTGQLAAIVAQAVRTREPGQDPATRTFQAVRIFVNQELAELSLVLEAAMSVLNPGGRLVVISFHSLEDRMVKRFISSHVRGAPLHPRLRGLPLPAFRPQLAVLGKPLRPSAAEVAANPRARSAMLRVAERLAQERA